MSHPMAAIEALGERTSWWQTGLDRRGGYLCGTHLLPHMYSYASPRRIFSGSEWPFGAATDDVDPALEPGALRLVARTADAYVYENPGTWPRGMFATQAQLADSEKLLSHGGLPAIDFGKTVLL